MNGTPCIKTLYFFLLHRRAEVWTYRCIFPCSNLVESGCDPSSRSYAATGIYQCNNNATILWWTGILPWCWHDGWRISSLHNSHVPGMLLQKLLCCIQVDNCVTDEHLLVTYNAQLLDRFTCQSFGKTFVQSINISISDK